MSAATEQTAQRHVLVTGAGGYIGTRLVPELLRRGHRVRATFSSGTPNPELWWVDQPQWRDRLECVAMDAADPAQVRRAVEGIDAVYYLIHAMGGDDFSARDREWATTMAEASHEAGVERIVYLSGLVPEVPEAELSEHITSRLEVERLLGSSDVPALTLRAGIVIGSGSTSFEMVRHLSERVPVRAVPLWLRSRVQPIAVVDVVQALANSLDAPAATRYYDVGGPDQLPYGKVLATYAEIARLVRLPVPLLVAPMPLVGFFAGRLTGVPHSTAAALVRSLHHDMVCADETDFLRDLLPEGHQRVDLDTAMRRALTRPRAGTRPDDRDPMGPMPGDPAFADGTIYLFDGDARRRRTGPVSRALLGLRRPRWA